jgi:NMD protein affecting ribosome stability and mRNA decay
MSPISKAKKAYLDVTVGICPHCGAPYADASWYALELGSDVECGVCGRSWNPKRSAVDRVLLEFELDDEGNVAAVRTAKCLD